ncbi:dihydropyrimidinase [Asimina triloba]
MAFLIELRLRTLQFCSVGDGDAASCGSPTSLLPKILIKGGTVVNAHHQELADVYIEDGIIVSVSDDVTVIDATGKYVMPGGIDPHTHLAMEFMDTETIDDFFSGQAAALAGGTTMHIDFVIPVNGSLTAGYESYLNKAKISCMDYGFHMAITKFDEAVAKEMEIMVKEKGLERTKRHARPLKITHQTLKITEDKRENKEACQKITEHKKREQESMLDLKDHCKSLGALAMVHAENGDGVVAGQRRMMDLGITGPEGHALSRPPVLEGEATARAIRLASFVNTPLYVVHVMSVDAMEEIATAQKSGQRVIGEPVVSGLVLNDSWLWHPEFTTAAKQDLLYLQVFTLVCDESSNKAGSAPFVEGTGFLHPTEPLLTLCLALVPLDAGIEERMHLIWDTMVESGKISATDFVKITSTACARIFNIYPRKGAILVGSDADVIVLDPNSTFEIKADAHHSRSDTNVYEGRQGKGKVEVTISRGRVVWDNGELNIQPGTGRYINMAPYSYLFDGVDKEDADYLSSLGAPVKRFTETS